MHEIKYIKHRFTTSLFLLFEVCRIRKGWTLITTNSYRPVKCWRKKNETEHENIEPHRAQVNQTKVKVKLKVKIIPSKARTRDRIKLKRRPTN